MALDEFAALLKKNLAEKAEWWRTNTNDPHGMNTAVYVALVQVSDAIGEVIVSRGVNVCSVTGVPSEHGRSVTRIVRSKK